MNKFCISLVLFLSSFYSFDLCNAQSKEEIYAKVTLMDKSTVKVHNPTFEYHWFYKDSWESYYNPTSHDIELKSFIYYDIISGAKIERNTPLKEMTGIEIIWKKRKGDKNLQEEDEVIHEEHLIITFRDSTTFELIPPIYILTGFPLSSSAPDLIFPSTFLQNKKRDEIEEPSFVTGILLKGDAIIDDTEGEFSATLYSYYNPKDKPSAPLITNILFFNE